MSQAKRGHLPYGYKIENGSAVVCEEEAAQLQDELDEEEEYESYMTGGEISSAYIFA